MLLRIKNIIRNIYNKSFKLYTDNKASKTSFENSELNSKLKHISVNASVKIDFVSIYSNVITFLLMLSKSK